MKQLPVGIAIAILASLIVSAQQTGSAEREVQRMGQAAADAFVKKDRTALERVYADEYSYIHSNGSVANKAQELSDAMSPNLKWTSSTLTDVKVRVYGDAAILTGVETLQGTAKGYVPGPRRVTDLWVNRNGRWQQLGGQSTIVIKDTSNTAALSAVKALTPKAATANTAEEGGRPGGRGLRQGRRRERRCENKSDADERLFVRQPRRRRRVAERSAGHSEQVDGRSLRSYPHVWNTRSRAGVAAVERRERVFTRRAALHTRVGERRERVEARGRTAHSRKSVRFYVGQILRRRRLRSRPLRSRHMG